MTKNKHAQTLTAKAQYNILKPVLNERQWRIYLGTEARKLGRGGISTVSAMAGCDRHTVARGITDSKQPPLADGRIRLPGGGRKRLLAIDQTLNQDLEALLDPKGDPMTTVKWTSKSLQKLAAALVVSGHQLSHQTVGRLLRAQGFSLQANKKNIEDRLEEGKV